MGCKRTQTGHPSHNNRVVTFDPHKLDRFVCRHKVADIAESIQQSYGDPDLLLAACAGCENTLHLVLNIADQEPKFERLAANFATNRGQAWRWWQACLYRLQATITLGKAAAAFLLRGETGFTLEPEECREMRGYDVWAVSVRDHGQRFAQGRLPNVNEITLYIAQRFDLLFSRRKLYLGGWLDETTREFCLDLTRLFPGEAEAKAIYFAKAHGQAAIFNLFDARVIRIKAPKVRAA